MVKKLVWFLGYFVIFMLALIAFSPKESIYYFAEKQLQAFDVVVSQESLEDKFFSLEIENAKIYGQHIEAAEVKKTSLTVLGVYNSVDVTNIMLSEFVESFLPQKIEHLNVNYSVLNPLEVTISANGGFGVIDGSVDLMEQNLSLVLKPSKLMLKKYKTTLREFKKDANGEYRYVKAL